MFRNYLVTAFRHLIRHPLYSAINIFGFAVGLACCIVILAFVRGELSYDTFVPQHERTYRVLATYNDGTPSTAANIMGPIGPALAADFPQLEAVARFRDQTDAVKRGDALFYETAIYADPTFFDVIALPLVAGDPRTAITEPNTLVISEAMAKKYFGDENPMGQVLTFGGDKPMVVTGILKDLPGNSHLAIDFLTNYRSASYGLPREEVETAWFNGNHYVYVRLKPGVTPEEIEAQLPAFELRHFPDTTTPAGRIKGGEYIDLRLQAFADAHLHSTGYGNMKPEGDITLVYAFSGIALMILLIASINFVVLTTARSSERAKEVGLRKVLGSSRRALMLQFLLETLVVTAIAFVIALSIAELVTPALRAWLDRPLSDGYPGGVSDFAGQLLVVGAVGLLAGTYPALYMSSLRPAEALKGKLTARRGRVRAALVVVQFAISIALIIVTTVMYAQTDYARTVRLGFSAEQMIVLRGLWRDGAREQIPALLARLRTDPSIESANGQQNAPGDLGYEGRLFRLPNDADKGDIPLESLSVDYGFLGAYEVRLLAGRFFDENRPGDLTIMPSDERRETTANAIITKAALSPLGFASADEAVGKPLDRVFDDENSVDTGQRVHYTIVGVVDDFQRRTARSVQNPVVFYVEPEQFWGISVKARAGMAAQAMAHVEKTWRELLPDFPVRAVFLDQHFANMYKRDQRQGTIFAAFAMLALTIACLGLFGLAAFTVDRRTKEIGVRKVLGASTLRIVGLLVWQFSLPVLIANAIAWPAAFFAARWWLADFNDRIDLSAFYFLAASVIVLAISWLTVSGHALKVARANPVRALRYE